MVVQRCDGPWMTQLKLHISSAQGPTTAWNVQSTPQRTSPDSRARSLKQPQSQSNAAIVTGACPVIRGQKG